MNKDWLLFIGVTIITTAPVFAIEKYTINKDIRYLIIGLLLLLLVAPVYIKLSKTHKLSSVFPILKIISIILAIVGGILFSEGKLTCKKIIAIFLAIIVIHLLKE